MNMVEANLRTLRIVHIALTVVVPMYAVAGELVGPKEARDVTLFAAAFAVMAATTIGMAFYFRSARIQPAVEALRMKPTDAPSLEQWRAGSIVCFVLAEAVAVYGFVLRFLGSSLALAAPFYAVSFLLLLLWTPRRPE